MIGILGRTLLVIVIAALAGAAAWAFSDAQPREYSSSMRFQYGRLLSPEYQLLGPSFSEADVDENIRIQTEAAGLESFDIARLTAEAAPELGYSAGAIAARVNARPVRETLTVVLVSKADSPEKAARVADVYGREYLALRRKRERRRAATVERMLRRQYNGLTDRERAGVEGGSLRTDMRRISVLKRLGSGNPQVLERPVVSTAVASPDTTRNVLFGIAFGLVVGVGLVALRSESRNRAVGAARRASNAVRAR